MAYGHGGRRVGVTVTPREIAYGGAELELLAGGITLDENGYDGGNTGYPNRIRAGWPLGMITTTKKWVPCKRTTTTTTGSVQSAVLVNSYPFKVGDVITINNDTDITITAIDYTTHTITWSGAKTIASGEAVFAQDGSQTCRGFLEGERDLYDEEARDTVEREGNLVIGGMVDLSKLLGDMSAIWADATSKALLAQRCQIYSPTLGRPLD